MAEIKKNKTNIYFYNSFADTSNLCVTRPDDPSHDYKCWIETSVDGTNVHCEGKKVDVTDSEIKKYCDEQYASEYKGLEDNDYELNYAISHLEERCVNDYKDVVKGVELENKLHHGEVGIDVTAFGKKSSGKVDYEVPSAEEAANNYVNSIDWESVDGVLPKGISDYADLYQNGEIKESSVKKDDIYVGVLARLTQIRKSKGGVLSSTVKEINNLFASYESDWDVNMEYRLYKKGRGNVYLWCVGEVSDVLSNIFEENPCKVEDGKVLKSYYDTEIDMVVARKFGLYQLAKSLVENGEVSGITSVEEFFGAATDYNSRKNIAVAIKEKQATEKGELNELNNYTESGSKWVSEWVQYVLNEEIEEENNKFKSAVKNEMTRYYGKFYNNNHDGFYNVWCKYEIYYSEHHKKAYEKNVLELTNSKNGESEKVPDLSFCEDSRKDRIEKIRKEFAIQKKESPLFFQKCCTTTTVQAQYLLAYSSYTFKKEMFQPGYVNISLSVSGNNTVIVPIKSELELLKGMAVTIVVEESDGTKIVNRNKVVDSFVIFDVVAKTSGGIDAAGYTLELKAYSIDKYLTLNMHSKCYTGKTPNYIMRNAMKHFSFVTKDSPEIDDVESPHYAKFSTDYLCHLKNVPDKEDKDVKKKSYKVPLYDNNGVYIYNGTPLRKVKVKGKEYFVFIKDEKKLKKQIYTIYEYKRTYTPTYKGEDFDSSFPKVEQDGRTLTLTEEKYEYSYNYIKIADDGSFGDTVSLTGSQSRNKKVGKDLLNKDYTKYYYDEDNKPVIVYSSDELIKNNKDGNPIKGNENKLEDTIIKKALAKEIGKLGVELFVKDENESKLKKLSDDDVYKLCGCSIDDDTDGKGNLTDAKEDTGKKSYTSQTWSKKRTCELDLSFLATAEYLRGADGNRLYKEDFIADQDGNYSIIYKKKLKNVGDYIVPILVMNGSTPKLTDGKWEYDTYMMIDSKLVAGNLSDDLVYPVAESGEWVEFSDKKFCDVKKITSAGDIVYNYDVAVPVSWVNYDAKLALLTETKEAVLYQKNKEGNCVPVLLNRKTGNKSGSESEWKIPYAVQYNESTYDFLIRTARKYGEFFYYETDDELDESAPGGRLYWGLELRGTMSEEEKATYYYADPDSTSSAVSALSNESRGSVAYGEIKGAENDAEMLGGNGLAVKAVQLKRHDPNSTSINYGVEAISYTCSTSDDTAIAMYRDYTKTVSLYKGLFDGHPKGVNPTRADCKGTEYKAIQPFVASSDPTFYDLTGEKSRGYKHISLKRYGTVNNDDYRLFPKWDKKRPCLANEFNVIVSETAFDEYNSDSFFARVNYKKTDRTALSNYGGAKDYPKKYQWVPREQRKASTGALQNYEVPTAWQVLGFWAWPASTLLALSGAFAEGDLKSTRAMSFEHIALQMRDAEYFLENHKDADGYSTVVPVNPDSEDPKGDESWYRDTTLDDKFYGGASHATRGWVGHGGQWGYVKYTNSNVLKTSPNIVHMKDAKYWELFIKDMLSAKDFIFGLQKKFSSDVIKKHIGALEGYGSAQDRFWMREMCYETYSDTGKMFPTLANMETVRENGLENERNKVKVLLHYQGSAEYKLRLGSLVSLEAIIPGCKDNFLVIGIEGGHINSSNENDRKMLVHELTLIPIGEKVKVANIYPHLPKDFPLIRTCGAQSAFVVENLDPSSLNRVRVVYPWQAHYRNLKGVNKKWTTIAEAKKAKLTPYINDFFGDPIEQNGDWVQYGKCFNPAKFYYGDPAARNLSEATPFIRLTSAKATPGAGINMIPEVGTEVIVDYVGGNIERPYVVGCVHHDTCQNSAFSATNTMSIVSPGGHSISMTDNEAGSVWLAQSLSPIGQALGCFIPGNLLSSADHTNDGRIYGFERNGGSLTIEDGLMYSISCNTERRSVEISSTYGTISLSSFNGVSISAPNGDVRIDAKNISLSAGNNISITSGANIKSPTPFTPKGGFQSWLTGSASTNAGNLADNVGSGLLGTFKDVLVDIAKSHLQLIDFRLIRTLLEIIFRPVEGTLKISSGRYLALSAGGGRTALDLAGFRPKKKSSIGGFFGNGMFNRLVGAPFDLDGQYYQKVAERDEEKETDVNGTEIAYSDDDTNVMATLRWIKDLFGKEPEKKPELPQKIEIPPIRVKPPKFVDRTKLKRYIDAWNNLLTKDGTDYYVKLNVAEQWVSTASNAIVKRESNGTDYLNSDRANALISLNPCTRYIKLNDAEPLKLHFDCYQNLVIPDYKPRNSKTTYAVPLKNGNAMQSIVRNKKVDLELNLNEVVRKLACLDSKKITQFSLEEFKRHPLAFKVEEIIVNNPNLQIEGKQQLITLTESSDLFSRGMTVNGYCFGEEKEMEKDKLYNSVSMSYLDNFSPAVNQDGKKLNLYPINWDGLDPEDRGVDLVRNMVVQYNTDKSRLDAMKKTNEGQFYTKMKNKDNECKVDESLYLKDNNYIVQNVWFSNLYKPKDDGEGFEKGVVNLMRGGEKERNYSARIIVTSRGKLHQGGNPGTVRKDYAEACNIAPNENIDVLYHGVFRDLEDRIRELNAAYIDLLVDMGPVVEGGKPKEIRVLGDDGDILSIFGSMFFFTKDAIKTASAYVKERKKEAQDKVDAEYRTAYGQYIDHMVNLGLSLERVTKNASWYPKLRDLIFTKNLESFSNLVKVAIQPCGKKDTDVLFARRLLMYKALHIMGRDADSNEESRGGLSLPTNITDVFSKGVEPSRYNFCNSGTEMSLLYDKGPGVVKLDPHGKRYLSLKSSRFTESIEMKTRVQVRDYLCGIDYDDTGKIVLPNPGDRMFGDYGIPEDYALDVKLVAKRQKEGKSAHLTQEENIIKIFNAGWGAYIGTINADGAPKLAVTKVFEGLYKGEDGSLESSNLGSIFGFDALKGFVSQNVWGKGQGGEILFASGKFGGAFGMNTKGELKPSSIDYDVYQIDKMKKFLLALEDPEKK